MCMYRTCNLIKSTSKLQCLYDKSDIKFETNCDIKNIHNSTHKNTDTHYVILMCYE